jgi:hypothetical protein
MTAPTTRHRPAASSPANGPQAQAQAQRQAYHRRKTRAKVKSEALQQKEAAHVEALPVQHPHAAGIDIGSRSHWVCVGFTTDAASCLIREFPAHTAGLKAIAAFLREHQVTTIALESTGIYWIPLYELLQAEGFEVLLVDPSYSHQLRGRRTAATASGSTGCTASACWRRPFGPTSRPASCGLTCGSGPT